MLAPLFLAAGMSFGMDDPPVGRLDDEIVKLATDPRIAERKNVEPLRAAYAKRFATVGETEIAEGLGEDKENILAWLAERPEFRDKFYTAFHEKDDVKAGMAVFRALWKKHADKLDKYDDLAIATAVVWDQPQHCEHTGGHMQRTQSTPPGNQVGALENFEYVIHHDAGLGGKGEYLPWEFLIFVVDHTTALAERDWARKYAGASKNKKSWHQDVPYDYGMLEAKNGGTASPRLSGKVYTLANIHEFGGVCAMQADFAARVGKSVLMPACYCRGDSAHRGGHAWWMYVRIDAATAKGALKCSLLSDGRFDGKDSFYTGDVRDPQTGENLLDRDLERRLAVVGRDAVAKRHADLCMRAYKVAGDRESWAYKDRLAYIDKVIKLAPANESAWAELAELAKSSETDPKKKSAVLARLSTMAKTFAVYPDFLWRHFPDMLTVVEKPKDRTKMFHQAIAAFNTAGRPDLTCAAAQALAEDQGKHEAWAEAARTLQEAVRKFPSEGRYVPKLTAQLEEIADKYKGGKLEIAKLYVELLPAMFAYYKSADDDYCKKMIDQATKYLDANGLGEYSAKIKSLAANYKSKSKNKGKG